MVQNTPKEQSDDRQGIKVDGRDEPSAAGGATATRVTDKASRPQSPGRDRDMGSALRSVYQQTVDESVPADLLDLLGKLD